METLEGLRDIGGFNTLEVSDRGSVNIHRRNDTIGHGGDDAVTDELLYPAGVAEMLILRLQGLVDGITHLLSGLGGKDVIVAIKESHGYLHQLGHVVVIELVTVREAAGESGVGVQHVFHLKGITGKDDEHIRIGLREDGKQRVEHATSEVLFILVADVEVVSLIDEEHIALGFFVRSTAMTSPLERSPREW